ncbi:unnamed protein product [Ceratitis capitata]|uniref:(Mediterranean fruit fly) hypothetical protein n=1 Tax=Ceratitis capitata TaxID=7213 RepID=A0A811U6R6_CERCA|nr:unnamed protein product [Ceratitis capitata]
MANIKAVFLICIVAFIAFHCVVADPTAEDSVVVKRSLGGVISGAKKVAKVAIPIGKAVLPVVAKLVG